MADKSKDLHRDEGQEPVWEQQGSTYNKYPLKPTMWQRVKEGFDSAIPNDLDAQREAVSKRKRRIKYNDTDSSDND